MRIRPLTSTRTTAAVAITAVVVSTVVGLYVAAPGAARVGQPSQAPECLALATPVEFVAWRSCMPEVPEPRPSGTASSTTLVLT